MPICKEFVGRSFEARTRRERVNLLVCWCVQCVWSAPGDDRSKSRIKSGEQISRDVCRLLRWRWAQRCWDTAERNAARWSRCCWSKRTFALSYVTVNPLENQETFIPKNLNLRGWPTRLQKTSPEKLQNLMEKQQWVELIARLVMSAKQESYRERPASMPVSPFFYPCIAWPVWRSGQSVLRIYLLDEYFMSTGDPWRWTWR